MNNINLKSIAGGMLQEKFEHSFERVIENMQDVNTPYKDKRKISIDLMFTQNEERDDVHVEIKIAEKLAAANKILTHFMVGTDLKNGKVFASEYGNSQLRGQLEMNLQEEKNTDVMLVDSETGEVIEPDTKEDNSVIDFRNVK